MGGPTLMSCILIYSLSLNFQDTTTPYLFFVNDQEIRGQLNDVIEKNSTSTEEAVDIIYQQQAVFTVRPITRCTR